MKTRTSLATKIVLAALPLSVLAAAGVAQAQIPPPPLPPDTYVATVDPVYYNGQPTYYYQNHWYWRDGGGRWQYYREEPGYLRDHRSHGPPARHYEEHRGGRR